MQKQYPGYRFQHHSNAFLKKTAQRKYVTFPQLGMYMGTLILVTFMLTDYSRWFSKLPYWDERLEKRRQTQAAFDFMIESCSAPSADIIKAFSSFQTKTCDAKSILTNSLGSAIQHA
eukprot:TRINITY_DN1773_c0_g3_i2.p1 TRINITY_DN1773_c0_g3~~TRINITY_DN1773_c0_g3_i2.p1  ORF type:complete len:117 (+),score=10.12 TRINITY_DN1773_c0_g3_i2:95-445(+)